uniref:transposase n=1 Tax=Micromonospora coerulea TaxID=47856 RepID=UPI001F37AA51
KMRRQRGKSDPIDAEAAARAVLAGTASTTPKNRDGQVEAIRVIRAARTSAVKSRTAATNALVGMVRTAPEPLRAQFLELRNSELIITAAALRPALDLADPIAATKTAIRRLARRIIDLDREIRAADLDLQVLLQQAAPRLMELPGVGPEVAAQLLITAGDNPERIRDESAFAALCGVSPIPASSGRTDRHRLNRGGDRMANRALYIVAINRMRCHAETLTYVQRRREQGLSNRDISRCLKRYIARQVYPLILESLRVRPPSSTALAGV